MQPFESDRIGPLAARVYRVKTADDVELAVTRLVNGSDDPTGAGEDLKHLVQTIGVGDPST